MNLTILRHGQLTLGAAGPGVVPSGLKRPLRAYDGFTRTLVFEKAGPVDVEVVVDENDTAPKTNERQD
jgi:copper(I)-binding protein